MDADFGAPHAVYRILRGGRRPRYAVEPEALEQPRGYIKVRGGMTRSVAERLRDSLDDRGMRDWKRRQPPDFSEPAEPDF